MLISIMGSLNLDAEFEAYFDKYKVTNISVEKTRFKNIEIKENNSLSVTCLYNGKMSTVTSNQVTSKNSIIELFNSAYKLAKNAGATDCRKHFSSKRGQNGINPYSKDDILDIGGISEKLINASKAASSKEKIYSIRADFSVVEEEISIANTNGINNNWKGNDSYISVSAVAKDGAEQESGGDSMEAINFHKLDINSVFDNAIKNALGMLGAKPTNSFKGQLLIDSRSACTLFQQFLQAINGENILKNRSFLVGKKDMKIASEVLEIREENSIEGSFKSRGFDDELIPTNSKYLIDGGYLKTFLYNIYSAEKMNEEPTGNGFDGSVGVTNIVIKKGSSSINDMIRKVDNGVYLVDTGDSPNISSGDLYANVMNGYYIKNGEIVHPVKETVIGINMLDLFMNISHVGGDVFQSDGIFSPSILVDNVNISGKI